MCSVSIIETAEKSTLISDSGNDRHSSSLDDFLQQPGKHAAPYSLIDMADDIRDLLHAFGIQRAHIVGRSMGGIIAQLFAYKYPELTNTLILLMSSSFNPTLPKVDEAMIRKLTNSTTSFQGDRQIFIKEKVDFMKAIYGNRYRFNEEKECALIIEDEYRKSSLIQPFRQIIALVSYTYDPHVLHCLDVPTLVIHGDQDPLFGTAHAEDLKNNIHNCDLILKNGMGHALPEELFPSLIENISDFIAKQFNARLQIKDQG